MSFDKFERDSYCVGGRHPSPTVKIYGNLTSKGSKVLTGYCSICNEKIYDNFYYYNKSRRSRKFLQEFR